MLSTVTLVFSVPLVGPISPATLTAASLAAGTTAVAQNSDFTSNIGLTLLPPITAVYNVVTKSVDITVRYSVLPPFASFQTVLLIGGNIRGSIVSSSPNDSYPNGTGARTLIIDYLSVNAAGIVSPIPKTQFVNLNGTTPVNLVPSDLHSINSLIIQSAGVLGNYDGLISMFSGDNGTGGLIFQAGNTGLAPGISNFQGSIVSTNPNDNGTGIGAQLLRVTYFDAAAAGPFTENIVPNGTTPVNFANLNHATITNFELITAGTYGSTLGTISLMSGLNGTGARIAALRPSFFQFFPPQTVVAPAIRPATGNTDFVANAAITSLIAAPGTVIAADIKAPLRNLMVNTLGQLLTSKVIAAEPLFA